MSDMALDPALSPVARGRLPLPMPARMALFAGVSAVAIVPIVWLMVRPGHKADLFGNRPAAFSEGREFRHSVPASEAPPKAPAPAAPIPAAPAAPPAPSAPAAAPSARPMTFWSGDVSQIAPRTVEYASAVAANQGGRAGASYDDGSGTRVVGPANGGGEYAQRLRPTDAQDVVVSRVFRWPQYTIPKGTKFGCLLNEPLDSQIVGPVSCTVTDDVVSMDGHNRLIRAGSTVNGQVLNGVSQGQTRLWVLWTDARTTQNIPIPLDSPAADNLGQVGVPGQVNEHTWAKLKNAVMLTAIQGAFGLGQAALQSGSSNTFLGSFNLGSAGPSLADTALQHDINIPTTVYTNRATPLVVYVNRNIDLHRVLEDVPLEAAR